MTDVNDPLDFDFEESAIISPAIAKKKRKVIGLDDLLEDYYKEKSKLVEKESQKVEFKKPCDSDEERDVDAREAAFSECVAKCEERMGQMSGDDEMPMWGLQVFGNQKRLPPVGIPHIGSCKLFQSSKDNELSSLLHLENEKGDEFLQGLLIYGWLLKLVCISGQLEESFATWTFNLMLYSSREDLRTSACDFWCAILQLKEADPSRMMIDWLPTYSELKRALEIYGFQLDSSSKISSDVDMDSTEILLDIEGIILLPYIVWHELIQDVHELIVLEGFLSHGLPLISRNTDSNSAGPPQNIRHWMKFVLASCAQRNMQLMFSIPEVEDLTIVIISLLLDRRLLGLSMMLDDCMIAVVSSFRDVEWNMSCSRVSKSLACRLPADVNSLRILESISGVDARSKQLRSSVAFQFLVSCFNKKVVDAEGILRLLMEINVKDKECNLFKMYMYLNLVENWLSFDPKLKEKPVIREMWGVSLRNCSCLISSTDMRPFASKVRIKAAYLLQGTYTKYTELLKVQKQQSDVFIVPSDEDIDAASLLANPIIYSKAKVDFQFCPWLSSEQHVNLFF